jgi:predicted secreted protein
MIKKTIPLLLVSIMMCGFALLPKGPIKVTNADAGKTIEVKIGRCVNVILEGNPTTGYGWEAAFKKTPTIKQVKDPEYNSKSDLIGAGGQFTFYYQAAGTGEVEMKFVYHRPWERKAPIKTFDVKISVK